MAIESFKKSLKLFSFFMNAVKVNACYVTQKRKICLYHLNQSFVQIAGFIAFYILHVKIDMVFVQYKTKSVQRKSVEQKLDGSMLNLSNGVGKVLVDRYYLNRSRLSKQ